MEKNIRFAAAAAVALVLAGCGGSQPEEVSTRSSSKSSANLVTVPVKLDDASRIASGIGFVAALHADGTVYAWGSNQYGQLGGGTMVSSTVPVPVIGLSGVKAVHTSGYHVAALRTDNTVWAWGNNNYGQLGAGHAPSGSPTPVAVNGMSSVKALAAGYLHSAAVKTSGAVWGWGTLPGSRATTPAAVPGLANVKTVAAGSNFNIALKDDGTLWGWGGNAMGQLGNGTRSTSVTLPLKVRGVDNVIAVSAGYAHALALRADGTVWGWGSDLFDQIGIQNPKLYVAQQVKGLPLPGNGASGVKAVVAGTYNSAVIYMDGTVWAWGKNFAGQLGNGSKQSSATPVQVASIANVAAVTIGDGFISLLGKSGSVHGIGQNTTGQLGNNTLSNSSVPVQVVGPNGVGYLDLGKSSAP